MARPKKNRKVLCPPRMIGYKPFGMPASENKTIKLTFEEFESIKMVGYDLLSQEEASEKMNVSRPTFTRIYNKAIKIIAKAFVEGLVLEIGGGNYQFEHDWYRCQRCFKLIEGLENHIKCDECPYHGLDELVSLNN